MGLFLVGCPIGSGDRSSIAAIAGKRDLNPVFTPVAADHIFSHHRTTLPDDKGVGQIIVKRFTEGEGHLRIRNPDSEINRIAGDRTAGRCFGCVHSE